MRFPILKALYRKEMLDMFRDRRTMISMALVPLVVFPLLIKGMTAVAQRTQQSSETAAKSMGLAVRITTPAFRDALEKTGMPLFEKDDLKAAVDQKTVAAAVEELPGTPPVIQLYTDSSNPTSNAAGDKVRAALVELRDQQIHQALRDSKIPESVLTPFLVRRTNIAGDRKMAGAVYGSILGYVLLLMMFTGGMYAVIDMTAGEKERKTMEALLSSPASRREIVMGKTLAAITGILITAALMVASLVYSFKNAGTGGQGPGAVDIQKAMGTIPLDPHTILLIALTLIPVAVFAASVMFAIALFARSFKEGQSYLTPLALAVIFPALIGGMPGLTVTTAAYLIPIFNTSQVIRGILLGDVSMLNFGVAMAANLAYAAIAFVIATRTFEKESVLFRS